LKRLLVVEGYMDVARLHQAGVNYAVATLGTATTPEHLRAHLQTGERGGVLLRRRQGRPGRRLACAGNALPEAREGRQIRFLFLPEGHDPDSLVGEEGARHSRSDSDGACRCPDTWSRRWANRPILAMRDGRAQFAELARPLVSKVAPGVYRDCSLIIFPSRSSSLPPD
jgi:DNA primase